MNTVKFVLALLMSWGLQSIARSQSYTPGEKVDKDFEGFAEAFLVDQKQEFGGCLCVT